MTTEFVRQDLGGTLAEEIRQAEAFVTSNMRRGMRIRALVPEPVRDGQRPQRAHRVDLHDQEQAGRQAQGAQHPGRAQSEEVRAAA